MEYQSRSQLRTGINFRSDQKSSKSRLYMDVLKNKCKYQKVIVDTYWNRALQQ